MKKLIFLILITAIFSSISLAMPAVLDYTKIDGTTIYSENTNRLNIERGNIYTVEVAFTPTEDLKDVEIEAFISGYEYNSKERISDMTGPFSAKAGVTYVKKLKIEIPKDAEQDYYKLRIIISDKNNEPIIANYDLRISMIRNELEIEDVIINPGKIVESGSAILVTVRVANNGEKDQKNIRVEASIPKLGVSSVEYIEQVKSDEEKNTEEIFLRIPRCSQPGVYEILIEAAYLGKREIITTRESIQVLEDKSCDNDIIEESQASITIGIQKQTGYAGSKLVYPITFSNQGNTARTFTITADETNWAEISVSPSNTVFLKGKETQTIYLNAKINDNTKEGTYQIQTSINTNGERKSVSFTSEIIKTKSTTSNYLLEIIVIFLAAILIITGLVIFFRSKEDKEDY
jgi:hypothetical protein